MQPTEPSSVEPATDAPVPTEASPDLSPEPSRATSFLQRLWRGRNGRGAGEGEEEQTEEAPKPPETITLTQAELDKRIDAETQRREAKRAAAADAERRRKLRDEDPWAYAEEERTTEQRMLTDAQVNSVFSGISTQLDRVTLDPVVLALPENEQKRILALDGAGAGLEGRKLIVTEALKSLEKHWKTEGAKDAEDKLRRNPAFRKQVLNEFRRGMADPEFIDSGTPSANSANVSNILRQGMSTHRSLNGR